MADRPVSPLYLERESYRRRRLIDAQRILPITLFILYLFPLMWGLGGDAEPAMGGARNFIHVFVIWALAIIVVGVLTHALARTEDVLEMRETDTQEIPTVTDKA